MIIILMSGSSVVSCWLEEEEVWRSLLICDGSVLDEIWFITQKPIEMIRADLNDDQANDEEGRGISNDCFLDCLLLA